MNEFTDIYGNRIREGDKVVYCMKINKYTSQFAKAQIIKFTNQKVRISLLDEMNGKEVIYKFLLVTPNKLIKAPIPIKPSKLELIKNKLSHYITFMK